MRMVASIIEINHPHRRRRQEGSLISNDASLLLLLLGASPARRMPMSEMSLFGGEIERLRRNFMKEARRHSDHGVC